MTLSEMLMLLTLLVAAGALIVQLVGLVFDITWKISHKNDSDNKKSVPDISETLGGCGGRI